MDSRGVPHWKDYFLMGYPSYSPLFKGTIDIAKNKNTQEYAPKTNKYSTNMKQLKHTPISTHVIFL